MAETDLERAFRALEGAHTAGKTEDAWKIAGYIRDLQESEEEPESLGALPFVNLAIAKTIGGPVDITAAGLGLIPGMKRAIGPEPVAGSRQIKRGMEAIGIRLPEEGQEPETAGEYIGQTVGEVAALMIPVGVAIKGLSTGTGLIGKITNSIWQGMVKHPYITMTSELTGGVGAGVGRYAGAEKFPESPTARTALEITGGIAGGMAPPVAIHAPALTALRQGRTL